MGIKTIGISLFLISPNYWEEEYVLSLQALLANTNIFEGEDEIHGPHNLSGQFNVKSYCKETFKGLSQLECPAKAIWKSKALTSVIF